MNPREVLEQLLDGRLDVTAALQELGRPPVVHLEGAVVDAQRSVRQGMPEVIYAEGKTTAQVLAIAQSLSELGQNVLATRMTPEQSAALKLAEPTAVVNEVARTVRIEHQRPTERLGFGVTAIVTAGTTDLPVAEEAAETLRAAGLPFERHVDVGVAGLHRVLERIDKLRSASVVICVAGMEGALPSVIGGLVSTPVVAVPTSVGYGAALGGFTPLLAMLTSCASGITVVNIGNGFGAAMAVHRMACAWEQRSK